MSQQPPLSFDQALALAIQHQRAGRYMEAEHIYRQILAHDPNDVNALQLLGLLAHQTGHNAAAIDLIRRAIALNPTKAEAHNNLGNVLLDEGRHEQARDAYQRALALNPSAEAHYNLANALRATDSDTAIAAYRRALELKSNFSDGLVNLGTTLKDVGRLDDAIDCYRQAAHLQPDNPAPLANVIYAMHFHPAYDLHAIRAQQDLWQQRHVAPHRANIRPHPNIRDPDRKLRIGYVSAHFFFHAECFFVVPLLEAHDKNHFDIFCYSAVRKPDDVTERLRRGATAWRDIARLNDDALAQRIQDDEIDILIDLSMHMGQSRLTAFARRPAPVQVSWLAYPGTTGTDIIDYRLSDRFMEPAGSDQSWSTETPIHLPDCWVVYDPVRDTPDVGPLPALTARRFTFASLNDPCKLNDSVIDLWSAALSAIPDSRLILRQPPGTDRARIAAAFSSRKIAPDRIEFVSYLSRFDYLNLYNGIDLALDTSPYNGITTTCDALFMGVPVLTLPGDRPQSRATLALLSQLDLADDFAPFTQEAYANAALQWSADLPRLARLRANLRQRMQTSPLMDRARFARNVESAYRQMWQRWCAST